MPATALTPTSLNYRTAVADPTEVAADATNGNSVINGGNTILRVRNADASNPHTLTVSYGQTVDGQTVTARQFSIPASATRWLTIGPPSLFGTTTTVTADSTEIKLTAFTH